MAAEGVSRPKSTPFHNKPTFHALSQAIDNAVQSLKEHEQIEVSAYENLVNQVCLSPRLTQWTWIVPTKITGVGTGSHFRISNISNGSFLNVYEDKVMLVVNSSLPSEEYRLISDQTLTTTLFTSIKTAQEVVQPRKDSDESDEAFFASTSDYLQGAGLDVALEESHPDALVEEDAELMEEIVAGEETETGERFWNNSDPAPKDCEPGQIAVDDEDERDVPELQKFSEKVNKIAASEAVQVKGEYKDNPEKSYPSTANTAVVSRLKSLQGRLLNIVEASFTDKEQRAAVKTLVNKEFRREMNNFNRGSWNGFSAADED
jgi:hypothetical protein